MTSMFEVTMTVRGADLRPGDRWTEVVLPGVTFRYTYLGGGLELVESEYGRPFYAETFYAGFGTPYHNARLLTVRRPVVFGAQWQPPEADARFLAGWTRFRAMNELHDEFPEPDVLKQRAWNGDLLE
jgi:hypothetical protein